MSDILEVGHLLRTDCNEQELGTVSEVGNKALRALCIKTPSKSSMSTGVILLTSSAKGLTTLIDWKNKDVYGQSLSSEKHSQMSRFRTWQKRICTKDTSERSLQFALSEIDRIASTLGDPRGPRGHISHLPTRTYQRLNSGQIH